MRRRYYCDHCKKGGGSKYHMANHERGCTLNPARQCGVCSSMELEAAPLPTLISLVEAIHTTYISPITGAAHFEIDKPGVVMLRERAGNCPACMLAALRQTKTFTSSQDFDFKSEMKSMWADHSAEHA